MLGNTFLNCQGRTQACGSIEAGKQRGQLHQLELFGLGCPHRPFQMHLATWKHHLQDVHVPTLNNGNKVTPFSNPLIMAPFRLRCIPEHSLRANPAQIDFKCLLNRQTLSSE